MAHIEKLAFTYELLTVASGSRITIAMNLDMPGRRIVTCLWVLHPGSLTGALSSGTIQSSIIFMMEPPPTTILVTTAQVLNNKPNPIPSWVIVSNQNTFSETRGLNQILLEKN